MRSSTVSPGSRKHDGVSYRIDPGRRRRRSQALTILEAPDAGLAQRRDRAEPPQLLENVHGVQQSPEPAAVDGRSCDSKAAPAPPNLDIEMETGTGKTYVYIKTIMELNKRYGWSKFIVVVPSDRDPRGREEVVRHHGRALPAELRHQAAHRSSTTRRSSTSWSGSLGRRACR